MTFRTIASLATALVCLAQGHCLAAMPAAASARGADTVAMADCSWNHPGANPFMGDVVAAIDRYQDIPEATRARLKARMAKRAYDEVVEIRRDRIAGRDEYGSEIADMHFGTRQLCHRVTRAAWTPQMQERGLVYCEQDQCILVPTVCRNVSRIQRRAVHDQPMHSIFLPAPAAGFPPAASGDEGSTELAGPIGWAPGAGAFAYPAGASAGGGAVFATSVGGVGGVGGGGGFASPGSPAAAGSGHDTVASAGGRQSARVMTTDADRLSGSVDLNADAPTAPVPEPETWALMAAGLLFSAARSCVLRRQVRQPGEKKGAEAP